MAERSEIRAGVFLLVALLLLGLGTAWIVGLKPWAGRQPSYHVAMKSSAGVRRGDRIRVSGVEVGRVQEVELAPGREWPVLFRITVRGDVEITAGSSARITSDGLLGQPYLEIVVPEDGGAPLPEGSLIVGQDRPTLIDALAGMGSTGERLPALVDRALELMETIDRETGPMIDRIHALLSEENAEALAASLTALGELLEDSGPRITALISRLEGLGEKLEEGVGGVPPAVEEMRALLGDLRQALGREGERLGGLLDSASGTLGTADGALSTLELNAAEIDAMLRDLREAAANLRSLSQTLKERPSLLLRSPRVPESRGEEP